MRAVDPSIYLDWNATTPPHPEVLEAMSRALASAWGNPASVHGPGRRARAHVDAAREAVAALTGLSARDVVLTSGGTEANNLALLHAFPAAGTPSGLRGGALVTSRLEHPSVVRVAEQLAGEGVVVVWAEPDPSGVVTAAAVEAAMDRAAAQAPVRVCALQAVNHETGVVQPVAEVAEHVHRRGALLHVDAVQAAGRLGPEAWAGADLVAVAAHKIRGPKGIGALVTRPGVRLRPVLLGGAQERGLRPGTQDPAGAAGFAAAAARAATTAARYAALAPLRDRLERELVALGRSAGAPRSGTAKPPERPTSPTCPGPAGGATSSAPPSTSRASPSPADPRAAPAPPKRPPSSAPCWAKLGQRPRCASPSARRPRPTTSTRRCAAGRGCSRAAPEAPIFLHNPASTGFSGEGLLDSRTWRIEALP